MQHPAPPVLRLPFTRHYSAIVVSDIHFHRRDSHPKYLYEFLFHNTCDTLILLGDTHEGYENELAAPGEMHQRVWDLIASRKAQGMQVIDSPGNHDSYKRKDTILGHKVFKTEYRPDLVLDSAQGRTFLLHGDTFDGKMALRYDRAAFAAAQRIQLGNKSLLDLTNMIQQFTNKLRGGKTGKPNKAGTEKAAANLARANNCTSVLTGHTHNPSAFRPVPGDQEIQYGNTGSWVGKGGTAMALKTNGEWEFIDWTATRHLILSGKASGIAQPHLHESFREQTRQEFLWQRAQHKLFTNQALVLSIDETMQELSRLGKSLKRAFDRARDEISMATEEVASIERYAEKAPLSPSEAPALVA